MGFTRSAVRARSAPPLANPAGDPTTAGLRFSRQLPNPPWRTFAPLMLSATPWQALFHMPTEHSQRGRGYDPAQKVWGGLLASSTVHQDRRAKEADGVSRQLRHAEPLTDDVPEPWWRVWSRPSCANPK